MRGMEGRGKEQSGEGVRVEEEKGRVGRGEGVRRGVDLRGNRGSRGGEERKGGPGRARMMG